MTIASKLSSMRTHEPLWIEVWSGITAMLWAKWVYWMPLDLSERQPYEVLSTLATDANWEWVAAVTGGMQVLSTVVNWRIGRMIMAFLMSWLWLCLAYGLWLGNQSAPGIAVYFGWGLANLSSLALVRHGPAK